jgi:hypothetical protein
MSATSTLAALLDSYEWRPAAEIEQKMSVAGYNPQRGTASTPAPRREPRLGQRAAEG